jgi:hypothetical protein
MARRTSPGYSRVTGTNAIGSDTQEEGLHCCLAPSRSVPAPDQPGW